MSLFAGDAGQHRRRNDAGLSRSDDPRIADLPLRAGAPAGAAVACRGLGRADLSFRPGILGSQEVGKSVRPGLDAVLLQQERHLAAMTGGVHRDVQQHLAARHVRGFTVREGEDDRFVDLFRQEGIGIVGIPVRRGAGLARQRVEGRELDRARRKMTVRARFEIVAEDLVDGLDMVEQPTDHDPFVCRQALEIFGQHRIQAVGRPALVVHQGAIGEGEHRGAFRGGRALHAANLRAMTHIVYSRRADDVSMARAIRTIPRKSASQKRSRVTVETLLDATARVLTRAGYDRASTNRIAATAGVSVGSLYQYFPNKEALVAALVARHNREMLQLLRDGLTEMGSRDLATVMRELVRAMVDAHLVDPVLHRIFAEQVPRMGQLAKIAALQQETFQLIRAYLEERRSEISVTDLDSATSICVTTVESLTHEFVINRPDAPDAERDQFVGEVTRLIVGYLRPGAAGRR